MRERHDAILKSYRSLELRVGASHKEIKSAYRRLMKKWHPDVFRGDPREATAKTHELNAAFEKLEVLSDSELAAAVRHAASAHRAPPRTRSRRSYSPHPSYRSRERSAPQAWPGTETPTLSRRGRDILGRVDFTWREERNGAFWRFVLPTCRGCAGWGAAERAVIEICTLCRGLGRLLDLQACPSCRGRGCEFDLICQLCGGSGESAEYAVHCSVAPGVERGSRGRLGGLGHPGLGDALAGDLYLVLGR